jgi:hypothetical protein
MGAFFCELDIKNKPVIISGFPYGKKSTNTEIIKMSYPTSYSLCHAGEWKKGERPISDKYLMHVKHHDKNYLYVIDECNKSDFLDWVLQTFGRPEAFEEWLGHPYNSFTYNEFTQTCSETIHDHLRWEKIYVTETYLADVIKLNECNPSDFLDRVLHTEFC